MAYTTIKKPSDYFNTILYTGDNSSPRTITGVGFQPDMNWSKIRSEVNDHWVSDAVRGANKIIRPNGTDDELVNGSGGYISSFNSDGYVIASGSASNNNFNKSSGTMVSWNWKANGAGSSNTDGSITSTVSANTTSGFSIVSYTGNLTSGATVGHGLDSAPKMVIVKNRSITEDWFVLHTSASATAGSYLKLNLTDAVSSGNSIVFNNTNPTSTVFTVGSVNGTNGSGNNMIAYCFADVKGFSKFGSYTGNGNADGTFIYTGFKPAFVLIKANASADWYLIDNKRSTFNVMEASLKANTSDAESTTIQDMDFLSNGFKPRSTSGSTNGSGTTYIYMAFAEEPLVGDNPATAR